MFGAKVRRGWVIVLGGVGTLAVASGIAYATIPNAGVIHACYSRSGGTLRVIDRSVTNCKGTRDGARLGSARGHGASGAGRDRWPGWAAGDDRAGWTSGSGRPRRAGRVAGDAGV